MTVNRLRRPQPASSTAFVMAPSEASPPNSTHRAHKAHTFTQTALRAHKAPAMRENHFPFSTRGPILLGTLSAEYWAAPAIMQNDVESEGHAGRR
jgi:hypothetical protein